VKRICQALVAAWLIACLSHAVIAASSAQASPSAEEHAGKPILRDDQSSHPGLTQMPGPAPTDLDGGRVAIALAAVIALIFLLRWGGRKMFPLAVAPGRSGVVKVLLRCPLAPRQQILLLQVGRRILVTADCASQLTNLCQITDADEVAALLGALQKEKTSPATAFTSWIAQAREAFGPDGDENETAEPKAPNLDVELPALGEQRRDIADLTHKVRDLARRLGHRPPAA